VIITKARTIRIEARLPEELWPEVFKAAAYLANRTPRKALGWQTPFEKLQSAKGLLPIRPNIAHLPREGADQILEVIDVAQPDRTLEQDLNEQSDEEDEEQIDSGGNQEEANNEQEVDSHDAYVIGSEDDSTPGLPTPEETPEPEPTTMDMILPSAPAGNSEQPQERLERISDPPREVRGNVEEKNIVQGKRSRKPPARYQAYLTDVTKDTGQQALKAAFNAGLRY
jgi:hypothetical protein